MMLLFLLLSIIEPFSYLAPIQEAIVVRQKEMQFVGGKIYYYEDEKGDLELPEILKLSEANKFQINEGEIFNRGPSDNVYWFRLTVINQTGEDLWLQVGDEFSTWFLDFYAPDLRGEYQQPVLLGALRPQENKLIPSTIYCVPLSKADNEHPTTYFFRIEAGFPQTHVFKIGTPYYLNEALNIADYSIAAFLGVLLVLLIYNLFLLITIRERLYLYYVIYLAIATILVPVAQGHPLFHHKWLWTYYFVFQIPFLLVITLFSSHYLELSRIAKRLNTCLWVVTLMGVVMGTFNFLFPEKITLTVAIITPILFVHNLTLMVAGITSWLRGNQSARFFVFGWFFNLSGVLIFLSVIQGFIPANYFTTNTMFLGFSLEGVLFALALGDRWNIIKKEKNLLQKQNLILVQNQKKKLEQMVANKTTELQKAYFKQITSNNELQLQKKELEETLKQKEEMQVHLVQSEKMTSLGILTAGIGHEINNPLNFIKGGFIAIDKYLIKDHKQEYEDLRPFLHAIDEGVRRCSAIITSLNLYSHPGGDMKEVCDVSSIIDNCLILLKSSMGSNLKVKKKYGSTPVILNGNLGKLHQVFMNILTNAIQAIDQNGIINIEITQDFEEATIRISDNGIGIKETDLPRISDPFFTTKPPGIGIGLGLPISYSIVQEHGGTISCDSKLNVGTEFVIKLPITSKNGQKLNKESFSYK